jgi:hypothetical protein
MDARNSGGMRICKQRVLSLEIGMERIGAFAFKL